MLALAGGLRTPAPAQAPVYSRLVAADLLTLRAEELLPGAAAGAAFELVAAADVLVYFGELGALLQAFAAVTAQGGDLALANLTPNPSPNPRPNLTPSPNPTQVATSPSLILPPTLAPTLALTSPLAPTLPRWRPRLLLRARLRGGGAP